MGTLAREGRTRLHAFPSILARVRLASLQRAARHALVRTFALAMERVDLIFTRAAVFTRRGGTLIDVSAARLATVSLSATAGESADAVGAGAAVLARRRLALVHVCCTGHTRVAACARAGETASILAACGAVRARA